LNVKLPLELVGTMDLNVPEEMRPRVSRKLGLTLEWDRAIDELPPVVSNSPAYVIAILCRFYRRVRPEAIGARCCFEPSCSRYA